MDMLQAYRAFLRVAETASFSRAAEDLRVQQSHVSRLIARLETELGVLLVRRTTRSVTLTEEGERLLRRLATILGALDACEAEIRSRKFEPVGLVRIACPTTLGRVVIGPLIEDFLACYPKARVELLMSNKLVDLAAEGIDIAVRVGRIPRSEYPGRVIGHVEQRLVAAPAYLARHRPIGDPIDLAGHNCLCFAAAGSVQAWGFLRGGTRRQVHVSGDFIADDAETLMRRCAGGHGIAVLPGWLLQGSDRARSLVRVMPDWRCAAMPLNLVCVHRKHRPQKIQAALRFLNERLRPFLVAPPA